MIKSATRDVGDDAIGLSCWWKKQLHVDARSGDLPCTMESHILKMPKTIASLALLFELIDGGRFDVGEASIRRALQWVGYLRSHANRLYSAGEILVENGARLIIERRDQLSSEFTVRNVHQKSGPGSRIMTRYCLPSIC